MVTMYKTVHAHHKHRKLIYWPQKGMYGILRLNTQDSNLLPRDATGIVTNISLDYRDATL